MQLKINDNDDDDDDNNDDVNDNDHGNNKDDEDDKDPLCPRKQFMGLLQHPFPSGTRPFKTLQYKHPFIHIIILLIHWCQILAISHTGLFHILSLYCMFINFHNIRYSLYVTHFITAQVYGLTQWM